MTDVWVSDLALVTRTRDGRIEGFVLQANSGEPIPGARCRSGISTTRQPRRATRP